MKMNSTTLKLSATIASLLTLICIYSPAIADEVKVPVGQQSAKKQGVDCPKQSMSKEKIEQHYGAPQHTTDAIGEPPISSWEYADCIVYFEYDRVIHAVLKH